MVVIINICKRSKSFNAFPESDSCATPGPAVTPRTIYRLNILD